MKKKKIIIRTILIVNAMIENVLVLTPQRIWDDLFSLAMEIKKSDFSPDIIIAIIRGGLEVTRTLSDLLEVKQV